MSCVHLCQSKHSPGDKHLCRDKRCHILNIQYSSPEGCIFRLNANMSNLVPTCDVWVQISTPVFYTCLWWIYLQMVWHITPGRDLLLLPLPGLHLTLHDKHVDCLWAGVNPYWWPDHMEGGDNQVTESKGHLSLVSQFTPSLVTPHYIWSYPSYKHQLHLIFQRWQTFTWAACI